MWQLQAELKKAAPLTAFSRDRFLAEEDAEAQGGSVVGVGYPETEAALDEAFENEDGVKVYYCH